MNGEAVLTQEMATAPLSGAEGSTELTYAALQATTNELLSLEETKLILEARFQTLMCLSESQQYLSEEDQAELSSLRERATQVEARYLSLKQQSAELQSRLETIAATVGGNAAALAGMGAELMAGAGPSAGTGVTERAAVERCRLLCCVCGQAIECSESRMCEFCEVREGGDFTEGIPRQLTVCYCKSCQRYETPSGWIICEAESKEMLAMLLKKLKKTMSGTKRGRHGLGGGTVPLGSSQYGTNSLSLYSEPRLVDARLVWTEPHSKRLKIQISVEADLRNRCTMSRELEVLFVVHWKQCADCTKSTTPHHWISQVQVRQRCDYKRTLLYLEQLILKHKAHRDCLKVVDCKEGMDFQFAKEQHAATFLAFLKGCLPIRIHAKTTQLISQDLKNNTTHSKFTTLAEICPISREDLVFLPKSVSTSIGGGISQLLLCYKISSLIHLIDPYTLKGIDLDSEKYWKNQFYSVLTKRHLTEFIVLNIEKVHDNIDARFLKDAGMELVEAEVARVKDFGVNDERQIVRTHLGKILKVGDYVLGYDLSSLDRISDQFAQCLDKTPFQTVLVKKVPPKMDLVHAERLIASSSIASDNVEMVDAMRDIEENQAG